MTFSEAAMIMMSGGSGNIQPLDATENKTYYAADYGCDGFNPVNVNVPDRYDEGYEDGRNSFVTSHLLAKKNHETYIASELGIDGFHRVSVDIDDTGNIKPLDATENKTYYAADYGCDGFNPVNVNVPDRYDEGYEDGYSLAESFYNNVVDNNKQYTLVFYLGDEIAPNLRWIMCSIRNTADMSEIKRFNWWPSRNMELCYNARFTKIWWVYDTLGRCVNPQVEIESTKSDGTNRNRYTSPFGRSELYPFTYNPSNTNIISRIPT